MSRAESSEGALWQSELAPQNAPGQIARFRLSIDVATGSNDLVGLIEVPDFSDGMRVLGQRFLYRNEFLGGITNFSDFDIHFDTTGILGHQLEYRVYWYGRAQMAHDKTTVYWKTGTQGLANYGYDDTAVTANAIGRRTFMQTGAADSLTWFGWDARGQLTSRYDQVNITGTYQNFLTGIGYDGAGRVVSQTYPSGEVLTTTYNNASQPITLRNQTPRTFVSGAFYNPLGQPTQVDVSNFQSNRYYYYGLNLNAPSVFGNTSYGLLRQTCVVSTTASNCSESQRVAVTPTILNLVYAYDPVGNVTAMDDRTRNVTSTFGYDDQDRLTSWTLGGVPKESYAYNPIGNLTSKTGLGTMVYTDTAHVHALTKITSGLVATYDANGNMLQRWTPSSWFTQTWNIFNQITRTVSAVTPTLDVRYFYDADNNLVRKLIGGAHTIYIGNYYEKNLSTRLMTQYYYFGGRRILMRVGTTVTSTVTFLHGDHLGSASVETNDSYGVKLAEMRYSPWGETYYQLNTLSTDKQFTGQRQEAGFGVYDYGARFYSPLFGRFLSADSVALGTGNPQALNRYSYVIGNPLGYVDIDGHIPYPITIRSFAPFADFGATASPGGSYHGDNRGYTTLQSVTSRVVQNIDFDTDQTAIAEVAYSHPSYLLSNPTDERTSVPDHQVTSPLNVTTSGDTRTFSFGTSYGGGNPFVPIPNILGLKGFLTNIDVFASFTIAENKKSHTLNVNAVLTGDNFPATEAFISDPSGQSVFIGIGFYENNFGKDTGPIRYLPGVNHRAISSIGIQIGLDSVGNFGSVIYQGSTYSVGQWNRRFTTANPHDRSASP